MAQRDVEEGRDVQGVERRQVLRGVAFAGVTGLGVYGLAGCGGGNSSSGGGGVPQDLAGEAIASASEIPVGGGKVFKEQQVVITQPSEGSSRRSARPALTVDAPSRLSRTT